MPDKQRLFRLTSDSNNGVFDTLMDEDIEILPGSELALQSVAFDRQSQKVTVSATNRGIDFGLLNAEVQAGNAMDIENWTARIPFGTYSQLVDGETLMEEISERMNAVTDMSLDAKNVVGNLNFVYSINKGAQWKMSLDSDGRADIQCKTQAPCQISRDTWSKSSAAIDTTVYSGNVTPPTVTGEQDASGTLGTLDYISRASSATPIVNGDYNDSYVWGKVRMNKGTGCIRARVAELTSAANDINFTIGLVLDKTVLEEGTLNESHMHYALRCMGTANAYQSKVSPAGTFQPMVNSAGGAAFTPAQVTKQTDALNSNDVVEIRVEGFTPTRADPKARTQIAIQAHQSGGVTSVNDPEVIPTVRQDADWYYFISFHKDVDELKLDMVEADLDSYEFEQNPRPVAILGSLLEFPVQFSLLETVVRPGWAVGPRTPVIPFSDRSASFNFSGAGIANFFNYPLNSLPRRIGRSLQQSGDYHMVAPKRAEFSVSAKNYILLFDNVPLSSFDTYSRFDVDARNANSGGSRRNILATIPVKEDLVTGTSITRIAYEPSSPNFIAIHNRSALITRSLRCRIMTATYDDVEIDGLASLTLLLRSDM